MNIRSHKRGAVDEAEKTSFAQLHPTLVGPRAPLGSRPVHGVATASDRSAASPRRRGRRRGVQIRSPGGRAQTLRSRTCDTIFYAEMDRAWMLELADRHGPPPELTGPQDLRARLTRHCPVRLGLFGL